MLDFFCAKIILMCCPVFQAMKSDKITPDVVDRCPEKLAEVAFPSGGQVCFLLWEAIIL